MHIADCLIIFNKESSVSIIYLKIKMELVQEILCVQLQNVKKEYGQFHQKVFTHKKHKCLAQLFLLFNKF